MSGESKLWWLKHGGLFIGIPFTLFVVGLIVYGNFFSSSSNEVLFTWEYRPELHICDTAPSWVRPGEPEFEKALEFWEQKGWAFNNITVGPCSDTCSVKLKSGEPGFKTCFKGKVVIDLMDQWFEPEHAGVCTYSSTVLGDGVMQDEDWATITLPEVIYGSDNVDDTRTLPQGVDAIVLAHEVGHCLVGLGHNEGPPVGCAGLNPKTGHIMNPNIYSGGWVDEALPEPPTEW